MSHPHPHGKDPIGHVPHPPTEPLEQPSAANRRLWVVAAALAVIALLAIVLTWQSLSAKGAARSAAAKADRACEQVQGLGQKCATEGAQESPGAQAVIPEPEVSGSLRPQHTHVSADPGGASAQAGQPGEPDGPVVNPGSDLIVGLTLRNHRLEVTYSDGTVVDAGRISGAPPAIVLLVGSPSPSPTLSLPLGVDPSPLPPTEFLPEGPDPTDTGPVAVPTEEMTYIP